MEKAVELESACIRRYVMKRRCVLMAMAALVSISFLFGGTFVCAEEVRGVTEDTIKIAILGDQTGPIAATWHGLREGFRTRIKYVNEQGGINGRKIKIIVEDTRASIPMALAAFKKIVFRDKVLCYWGPSSTSEFHALFPQIEKEKMPTTSPSPTQKALIPFKRYAFIVCTLYSEQVKVMVDYLVNDMKVKNPRIAIVYADNESGRNVLYAAREYAKHYNLNIVSEQVLNFGSIEASSQVLNLKRAKADYVFHLGTVGTSSALLREARKLGYKAAFFDTMYGCDEDTVKMVGSAAKNFYGAHQFSPWHDKSPGMAELQKITIGYDPGSKPRNRFYTQSWVVGMIFTEAMKRAGRNLNAETFVNSMESIKDFDTKGLCGLISFGPKNHKALVYDRVYKADVEKKVMVPVTGWRKPLPIE